MVGHALTADPLARAGIVGTIATLLIDLNMTFHLGHYLGDKKRIGAIGFEPTASRSRTERTTRLCYAPNVFYEGFRSRQVSLTCHCDVLAHRCECAPTKDISSNNLMRYHTNSLGIGAIRPGTCRLRRNRAVLRPDAVHVTP